MDSDDYFRDACARWGMLDDWTRKRKLYLAVFAVLLVTGLGLVAAAWDEAHAHVVQLQVLADALLVAVLAFRPGLLPGFEPA